MNMPENRSLNGEELWRQLSNATSLRSSEDQALWIISSIFWAANAVLLVALFNSGGLPDSKGVILVIMAVGGILSLLQFFLQGRALGHIRRYEELIKRLESWLNFDNKYAVRADLNTEDADKYLGGKQGNILRRICMGTLIPARNLMQRASAGAALIWLIFFFYFLLRTNGRTEMPGNILGIVGVILSYVAIGITLVAAGWTVYSQGTAMANPDQQRALGRQLQRSAWIWWVAGTLFLFIALYLVTRL